MASFYTGLGDGDEQCNSFYERDVRKGCEMSCVLYTLTTHANKVTPRIRNARANFDHHVHAHEAWAILMVGVALVRVATTHFQALDIFA